MTEQVENTYPGPKNEFIQVSVGESTFRIGDVVCHQEDEGDGLLGRIYNFYTGGQGHIVAQMQPLKMTPDPNDPHADCLICQSWSEIVEKIELHTMFDQSFAIPVPGANITGCALLLYDKEKTNYGPVEGVYYEDEGWINSVLEEVTHDQARQKAIETKALCFSWYRPDEVNSKELIDSLGKC